MGQKYTKILPASEDCPAPVREQASTRGSSHGGSMQLSMEHGDSTNGGAGEFASTPPATAVAVTSPEKRPAVSVAMAVAVGTEVGDEPMRTLSQSSAELELSDLQRMSPAGVVVVGMGRRHSKLTEDAGLYLGSIDYVVEDTILDQFNISAIVSVLPNEPAHIEAVLEKHNIKLEDYFVYALEDNAEEYISLFDSPSVFSTVDFIHDRRLQGKTVLVHCDAGITRSPTVIVAYIMKYGLNLKAPQRVSLKDSLSYVRQLRERVDVCVFHAELEELERILFGESVDPPLPRSTYDGVPLDPTASASLADYSSSASGLEPSSSSSSSSNTSSSTSASASSSSPSIHFNTHPFGLSQPIRTVAIDTRGSIPPYIECTPPRPFPSTVQPLPPSQPIAILTQLSPSHLAAGASSPSCGGYPTNAGSGSSSMMGTSLSSQQGYARNRRLSTGSQGMGVLSTPTSAMTASPTTVPMTPEFALVWHDGLRESVIDLEKLQHTWTGIREAKGGLLQFGLDFYHRLLSLGGQRFATLFANVEVNNLNSMMLRMMNQILWGTNTRNLNKLVMLHRHLTLLPEDFDIFRKAMVETLQEALQCGLTDPVIVDWDQFFRLLFEWWQKRLEQEKHAQQYTFPPPYQRAGSFSLLTPQTPISGQGLLNTPTSKALGPGGVQPFLERQNSTGFSTATPPLGAIPSPMGRGRLGSLGGAGAELHCRPPSYPLGMSNFSPSSRRAPSVVASQQPPPPPQQQQHCAPPLLVPPTSATAILAVLAAGSGSLSSNPSGSTATAPSPDSQTHSTSMLYGLFNASVPDTTWAVPTPAAVALAVHGGPAPNANGITGTTESTSAPTKSMINTSGKLNLTSLSAEALASGCSWSTLSGGGFSTVSKDSSSSGSFSRFDAESSTPPPPTLPTTAAFTITSSINPPKSSDVLVMMDIDPEPATTVVVPPSDSVGMRLLRGEDSESASDHLLPAAPLGRNKLCSTVPPSQHQHQSTPPTANASPLEPPVPVGTTAVTGVGVGVGGGFHNPKSPLRSTIKNLPKCLRIPPPQPAPASPPIAENGGTGITAAFTSSLSATNYTFPSSSTASTSESFSSSSANS